MALAVALLWGTSASHPAVASQCGTVEWEIGSTPQRFTDSVEDRIDAVSPQALAEFLGQHADAAYRVGEVELPVFVLSHMLQGGDKQSAGTLAKALEQRQDRGKLWMPPVPTLLSSLRYVVSGKFAFDRAQLRELKSGDEVFVDGNVLRYMADAKAEGRARLAEQASEVVFLVTPGLGAGTFLEPFSVQGGGQFERRYRAYLEALAQRLGRRAGVDVEAVQTELYAVVRDQASAEIAAALGVDKSTVKVELVGDLHPSRETPTKADLKALEELAFKLGSAESFKHAMARAMAAETSPARRRWMKELIDQIGFFATPQKVHAMARTLGAKLRAEVGSFEDAVILVHADPAMTRVGRSEGHAVAAFLAANPDFPMRNVFTDMNALVQSGRPVKNVIVVDDGAYTGAQVMLRTGAIFKTALASPAILDGLRIIHANFVVGRRCAEQFGATHRSEIFDGVAYDFMRNAPEEAMRESAKAYALYSMNAKQLRTGSDAQQPSEAAKLEDLRARGQLFLGFMRSRVDLVAAEPVLPDIRVASVDGGDASALSGGGYEGSGVVVGFFSNVPDNHVSSPFFRELYDELVWQQANVKVKVKD
jgi:hypothetical protein